MQPCGVFGGKEGGVARVVTRPIETRYLGKAVTDLKNSAGYLVAAFPQSNRSHNDELHLLRNMLY